MVEVFRNVLMWFVMFFLEFIEKGGYLGFAVLLFPILRKVCYLFKQFTN